MKYNEWSIHLMYEWLSQCCEAVPVGEVSEDFGEAIGFCSKCLDSCDFYEGEIEVGEPFDTQEEKRGER